MKKQILAFLAAATVMSASAALPKALYVKQGDNVTKYNFGVAGDLNFSENGHKLSIVGYDEVIDLDAIDYISFSAPSVTAMTPAENKQRMLDIAAEVNKMVSANDQAEAIKMVYTFLEDVKLADGTEISAPQNYGIDSKYFDVHNEMNRLVRNYLKMFKGNAAAVRAARTNEVNLYKLQDYYGVFTANPATRYWDRTSDADYLEFRYRSADSDDYYSARLEASENFTRWNTSDFDVQLPESMTVTMSKGSKLIAKTVITSRLKQDESIEMNIDFSSNGYCVHNSMLVLNDKIGDKTEVSVNGKYLMSATTEMRGQGLLDYDQLKKDFDEAADKYDDNTYEEIYGDNTALYSHFGYAGSEADLIGSLQMKARFLGLKKVADVMDTDSWLDDYLMAYNGKYIYTSSNEITKHSSDYSVIECDQNDPEVVAKQARYMNNYLDVTFAYDGKKGVNGYLGFEDAEDIEDAEYNTSEYTSEDTYGYIILNNHLVGVRRDKDYAYDADKQDYVETYSDWYYEAYDMKDGYIDWENQQNVSVDASQILPRTVLTRHEYEVYPKLIFPDGTSFLLDDYFTEKSFQPTIDDYNSIIDTYKSIISPIEQKWEEEKHY